MNKTIKGLFSNVLADCDGWLLVWVVVYRETTLSKLMKDPSEGIRGR